LALAAAAGSALAGAVVPESAQYGGSLTINVLTGETSYGSRAGITVYDNSAGTSLIGTSSTNLSTTWGDNTMLTGTGILEEFSCSIFNSGSSATAMASTDINIGFNQMVAGLPGASLGGFTGTVTFGTPLAPGFFSVITFVGLSGLSTPVNLSSTDILVRQQLSATVGSTRAGIVSANPIAVGSSPPTFWKDDPSSPPAGFYVFASGAPADVLYKMNIIPAPGAMALLGLGGLLAGRRRR
jgi:hypothetical protein